MNRDVCIPAALLLCPQFPHWRQEYNLPKPKTLQTCAKNIVFAYPTPRPTAQEGNKPVLGMLMVFLVDYENLTVELLNAVP